MSRFKGKSAIVTGAGSGIGFAIAQTLAQEGASVVVNDVDTDLIRTINNSEQIQGLAGDMSSMDDIQRLVEFTLTRNGGIDLLIANAGTTQFAPFFEMTESQFDQVVDLNLKGTFFLSQLVAREMRSKGGKIVLMSSNISRRAYRNLAVYSMTKSAINMMARSLALELSPYKININALAPGATVTERTLQEGKDYRKTWSEIIPTGRPAEVQDIANTCLFLLSENARQINGQTIVVDGGWSGISVNPE